MTEREQLVTFFSRLGATSEQADSMAAQIAKRCDQWVTERGVSRTEAMAKLLEMVLKGRMGETPAGFPATRPPSPPPEPPPETR